MYLKKQVLFSGCCRITGEENNTIMIAFPSASFTECSLPQDISNSIYTSKNIRSVFCTGNLNTHVDTQVVYTRVHMTCKRVSYGMGWV